MSDQVPDPEVLTLDITTPDGRLRGNLAVPPGEMRLSELAWNMMALDGKLVDMAIRRHAPDSSAISCRKGCGACCRQVVPLSPPEAWMLADLIMGMPEARQDEVLARFTQAEEALEASGLKGAFSARIDSIDALKSLSIAYFSMGIPCPFLEDESCSIHASRPSICREYLVTSPAENCAALGTKPIQRIPMSVRLSESLSRLTARLLGGEPQVIPLVMALDWAYEHRDEGQRRWSSRELLQGLVEELARPPG